MRRSMISLIAISFLALTTGCVEMQRTCNSQEMIAMKEKGFGIDDIDKMCSSYKVKEESVRAFADAVQAIATNPKDQSNSDGSRDAHESAQSGSTVSNSSYFPPAFSNNSAAYCTTQYGSCSLGVRAPAGLVCQCQTPYGPIPGVTQ
jgi:hypothetical protein